MEFIFERDKNYDREILRLKRIPEKVEKAIQEELIATAQFIRNTIIRNSSNTPKTGRRYRKTKNKNIFHIASSPGYYPARDTGEFLRSIKTDVRKGSVLASFEVEVGSNLTGKDGEYPTFLEFGTDKMDERPWLEPSTRAGEVHFNAMIRKTINQALR